MDKAQAVVARIDADIQSQGITVDLVKIQIQGELQLYEVYAEANFKETLLLEKPRKAANLDVVY